jgi:hydroxylamine reductase
MPPTSVVLTLGCGKYRVNFMDLGTIGATGIPRILDAGQCNDSYSAVQIALALAGALKCEVKDLPLSIVLSWLEQKAVAVLLSLLSLGMKPIHYGPHVPAFFTPAILQYLEKECGLIAVNDAAVDVKKMCTQSGMA